MEDENNREPSALTLIVKSPISVCEDQAISGVLLTWTVKELKDHLSRVYPGRPAEKEQRLIYCGKLLQDSQLLGEVFIKSNTTPTIHLVSACKPQPGRWQGPAPRVPAGEDVAVTPAVVPGDGLRNRGHPADQSSAQASSSLGAAMTRPVFPAYSLYSPQQLLWLQQVYTQQYYMHYHAALAAAASARVPVSSSAIQSLPVDPQPAAAPVALPDLPADQNVPAPQFVNPAGGNQNLRMNAQGGPVMEEEEDMERDWLDWLYTAARLAVLLSIVYFYSSISRFVLVMSSLVLMYLHTAGWFPFQRVRPAVIHPHELGPEVPENREQEQQVDVPPTEAAEVDEGDNEQPSQMTDMTEPQRIPLISTAWVFFKAFFASLVPDVPQPLVN
ncbi:homocysteine-responsive endoplasmic reticulum-resident ubiquitin-like domain member 1 protein [Arapaima gigas]